MPVSVTQPKNVKVSSQHGDIIKVSIVKGGTDTKVVTVNQVAKNNITIQGVVGGGGGDSSISSQITVSNNDAAFSHMTSPIAAGTSVEAILRDMLEVYNRTTISMSSITRALQGTDGNYGSASTLSSSETLEVGQGCQGIRVYYLYCR